MADESGGFVEPGDGAVVAAAMDRNGSRRGWIGEGVEAGVPVYDFACFVQDGGARERRRVANVCWVEPANGVASRVGEAERIGEGGNRVWAGARNVIEESAGAIEDG